MTQERLSSVFDHAVELRGVELATLTDAVVAVHADSPGLGRGFAGHVGAHFGQVFPSVDS